MQMAAEPSMLDKTIDMLGVLTDEQLKAIQGVAQAFVHESRDVSPYRPLSERELCDRIDLSLQHVSNGLYEDADVVEAELYAGLAV